MARNPEARLRGRLVRAARSAGWRVFSSPPLGGQLRAGDPGFPDLMLLRDDRCLALEIKAQRGKVTAQQREWGAALAAAGIEWHLVRPDAPRRSDAEPCLSEQTALRLIA